MWQVGIIYLASLLYVLVYASVAGYSNTVFKRNVICLSMLSVQHRYCFKNRGFPYKKVSPKTSPVIFSDEISSQFICEKMAMSFKRLSCLLYPQDEIIYE